MTVPLTVSHAVQAYFGSVSALYTRGSGRRTESSETDFDGATIGSD